MSGKMNAKAIVTSGKSFAEKSVELPALGPHEILVRVHFAAFNPTDRLAFDVNAFGEGAVLGCDFSGIVEATGNEVSRFVPGDHVGTFIWGGELPNLGAYSQLCIADERIAFKVPESVTLEQAATIPLAATTSFLALFSKDCLGLEQHQPIPRPLMVLGGSSSVGSFALEIAATHGIEAITTVSQKNTQVALDDGAKAAFDYHDETTVQQVRAKFPRVNLVFDTIGNPSSTSTVSQLLESDGGKLCTVRPGKVHTENLPSNIQVSDVFVFTAFLKEHSYRGKAFWPVNEANHALASQFFNELPNLLASGAIKPRPVRNLGPISAKSITTAIKLVGDGKVSNEKLVFSALE